MRFPCSPLAAFSFLIACICFVGAARADSVSFIPVSDRDAGDRYPFTNGLTGPEDVPFMSVGVNNPANPIAEIRAAMEFDVSTLPMGATIDAANLTLWVYALDAFPGVEVHGYSGDGVVETADMLPINPLATFASPGGATDVNVILDVTFFMQTLVNGSMDYAGFSFRTAGGALLVSSREAFNPDLVPSLEVTFTPGSVPDAPSLSLLSLGLAGLLASRRRNSGRKPGFVHYDFEESRERQFRAIGGGAPPRASSAHRLL